MNTVIKSPEVSVQQLKGGAKAWLVCFASAMFFFYQFIQMQMFDAINEPLRHAFNINASQLSLLSSSYLWGDLAFLLPAGMLLDRYSTKKTLIITTLLCIVSTLGFAWTSHFGFAAFCHFLTGIGNAFCFLACVILAARWFPANRQALVIGLVVTIAFLGGMVAQSPLERLSDWVGWRQALLLDAILGVGVLALIYAFVEDHPEGQPAVVAEKSEGLLKELWMVIKNPQNTLAGIYISLLNLPIMVLCALWGGEALKVMFGLSATEATNVVMMIFIGSIVGCPLAGWFSDESGRRRRPMLIGAVLSLIVVSIFMLVSHPSLPTLSCLFFLLGMVTSTQVIGYPLVAESNKAHLTGTATAWTSFFIMGGAAIAQLVFGELLDWHWQGVMDHGQRIYSATDFHFAMMLFPVSFIIAIVAMIFTRETFCRRQTKEMGCHD